jgi:hypothetical protein
MMTDREGDFEYTGRAKRNASPWAGETGDRGEETPPRAPPKARAHAHLPQGLLVTTSAFLCGRPLEKKWVGFGFSRGD